MILITDSSFPYMILKDLIAADTFKIEMKDPYSPVYMTCIEEAKKDLRAKARPELVSTPMRYWD